ncbi:MAG: hypothetical protein FWG67_08645 [Defluviitaleaceae bacterium]|nr:hypothetical protein [Defluviitaleaceae bacterium]
MIQMKLVGVLEKMFDIGGNHDVKKSLEIREELLEFLRGEELLLAPLEDENVLLAKNAIHFLDANETYAQTSNMTQARTRLQPFFKRLLASDDWNYYELKLLVGSIYLASDAEEAQTLAIKGSERSADFRVTKNVDVLEGGLACNLCARFLYAKYFEMDTDAAFIAEEFETWFHKLRELEERHYELELPLQVTEIRHAILKQDEVELAKLMEKFEDESDYLEDVINLVISEVRFYTTSKGYLALKGGEE